MEISRNMPITAVMEMMGTEASREEAAAMIEFLIVGDYTDTDQIG